VGGISFSLLMYQTKNVLEIMDTYYRKSLIYNVNVLGGGILNQTIFSLIPVLLWLDKR